MNTFMALSIQAVLKPGTGISAAIAEAKKLSDQHLGAPVEFTLHGVKMLVDSYTSETNAYWQYMRALDEGVT